MYKDPSATPGVWMSTLLVFLLGGGWLCQMSSAGLREARGWAAGKAGILQAALSPGPSLLVNVWIQGMFPGFFFYSETPFPCPTYSPSSTQDAVPETHQDLMQAGPSQVPASSKLEAGQFFLFPPHCWRWIAPSAAYGVLYLTVVRRAPWWHVQAITGSAFKCAPWRFSGG